MLADALSGDQTLVPDVVLSYFSTVISTAAVTCWSPHASSTGGRSSRNFELGFNRLLSMATSTSWTPERPVLRKKSIQR